MPSTSQSSESASFTESMEALEKIVDTFQTETLPLEEALNLFEKGLAHIKQCQTLLSRTRQQVDGLLNALEESKENDEQKQTT